MTIAPLVIFGTLSLLYLIFYGLWDTVSWLLKGPGQKKEVAGAENFRGRDPYGVKKARAKQDALGSKKVARKVALSAA